MGRRPDLAETAWQRLRGLSFRDPPAAGEDATLHLPRCRSVHTFGMRFTLDLVWLDAAGVVVRVDRDVPPRRLRTCLRARSVVETPAGGAQAALTRLRPPCLDA